MSGNLKMRQPQDPRQIRPFAHRPGGLATVYQNRQARLTTDDVVCLQQRQAAPGSTPDRSVLYRARRGAGRDRPQHAGTCRVVGPRILECPGRLVCPISGYPGNERFAVSLECSIVPPKCHTVCAGRISAYRIRRCGQSLSATCVNLPATHVTRCVAC